MKKFLCLSALLALNLCLEASSLPIPIGTPIILNPSPVTNPDPILQNLTLVMDDHYQPPYYPGVYNSPTYLENIILGSNFNIAASLIINPCNDQIMHLNMGQNQIYDLTETFQYCSIGTSAFGISNNKGLTWNYLPPSEQIIPLGGTVSQMINSSIGPGLRNAYTKNGTLYSSGWGFFDMRANPPNNLPMAGFLFTTSNNEGLSWSPIQKVLSTPQDFEFTGPPYFNPGLYPREFYVTSDLSNPDIFYASSMSVLALASKYGVLQYSHSENQGKTFSDPLTVYNMWEDPRWQSEHFNPSFISDPNYFIYGGFALASGRPLQVDSNTLLLPLARIYPIQGLNAYNPTSLSDMDQGALRSIDNGKTWENSYIATEMYKYPRSIYDPGFIDPSIPQILEGQAVFGFNSDNSGQTSNATVSPTTGRVYLAYSAGNPISVPLTARLSNYMLLNSSVDKGVTWSPSVQINATPRNIPIRAQQCFSGSMTATLSGQIVVAYYDFRYWEGVPGEDLTTTTLPMDAWLAVYDETEDPNGGSTGVGLDFVGEIRLSPTSSNARIPNITPPPGFLYTYNFVTGTPEGIPLKVNQNNELYVVFSMTQPGFRSKVLLNQYKGMTIDTNSYYSLLMSRFKFPNPTNN